MPGATTAAGYGWAHQKARKWWRANVVDLGLGQCTRCGCWINPDEPWHLDHNDSRTGYLGPACASCNTRAGALKGAAMRKPRPLITSRVW